MNNKILKKQSKPNFDELKQKETITMKKTNLKKQCKPNFDELKQEETITMKKLTLKKQTKPNFDELYQMLDELDEFYKSNPDYDDKQWVENLNTIMDFQDEDGSFKLFTTYNIPSDAKIDFIYMPTYTCTAALMKTSLTQQDKFGEKEKAALFNGLKMSTTKKLWGHGYEGMKGQIEALHIFMNAGLNEFIDKYPDFCPEFSEMIADIKNSYHEMESQEKFYGPWGESYEEDIKSINEYFCQRLVFVYGTLMEGESNHSYLKNSTLIGPATIKGYDMYDVGWYPAITTGESIIIGELYQVPLNDMTYIDMLEGEGSLYKKRCETATTADGENHIALVYIYLEDTMNLKKIQSWKNNYVWYVSYGSNMLNERFMCYIEGGSYEDSRFHPACEDTSAPVAVKTVTIPFDMYFANTSGSWHGSGVSFLDTTRKGEALGVAYLITKKQLEHVILEENAGRKQNPAYGWYEDTITLGEMDGFEMITITNNHIRPYNNPTAEYLATLHKGIKENWPEMSDEDIEDYLDNCIRNY